MFKKIETLIILIWSVYVKYMHQIVILFVLNIYNSYMSIYFLILKS